MLIGNVELGVLGYLRKCSEMGKHVPLGTMADVLQADELCSVGILPALVCPKRSGRVGHSCGKSGACRSRARARRPHDSRRAWPEALAEGAALLIPDYFALIFSRSLAASSGRTGSVMRAGSSIALICSSLSSFFSRAISMIERPLATASLAISAALANLSLGMRHLLRLD